MNLNKFILCIERLYLVSRWMKQTSEKVYTNNVGLNCIKLPQYCKEFSAEESGLCCVSLFYIQYYESILVTHIRTFLLCWSSFPVQPLLVSPLPPLFPVGLCLFIFLSFSSLILRCDPLTLCQHKNGTQAVGHREGQLMDQLHFQFKLSTCSPLSQYYLAVSQMLQLFQPSCFMTMCSGTSDSLLVGDVCRRCIFGSEDLHVPHKMCCLQPM